ncbi:MAG: iron-sulfur cluster assembly protein [Actinomycetota bacterium]|nr:iron-sulfur cluster assembly protein [Actinomycetota bacterium]
MSATEADIARATAISRDAADPIERRVWVALDGVMDPELDEPVTALGFVHELAVSDGVARVRLRLPTYFCAPNFAWMMVADAHDAVSGVAGVVRADVALDDYFASDEINAGVASAAGFAGSFSGEATTELAELRLTFQRKAYTAALERVCRLLRQDGMTLEDLATLVVGDVPVNADGERLGRRRLDLGLGTDADAPLLVDERGEVIAPGELAMWLRRAQTVRVNIEGNGELCRGLLRTRYHLGELEEQLSATGQ